MAKRYCLICRDCAVYLDFGEVYWIDRDDNELDEIKIGGFYSESDSRLHLRDEFFSRVVERFLLLHRNHELRFVPEGVDEVLEGELGYVRVVDPEEILATDVLPRPNAWEEREAWRKQLSGRGNNSGGEE